MTRVEALRRVAWRTALMTAAMDGDPVALQVAGILYCGMTGPIVLDDDDTHDTAPAAAQKE